MNVRKYWVSAVVLISLAGCSFLEVDVDIYRPPRCVPDEIGNMFTDHSLRDVAADTSSWREINRAQATGWFGNSDCVLVGNPISNKLKSVKLDPTAFIDAGANAVRTTIKVAAQFYGAPPTGNAPTGTASNANSTNAPLGRLGLTRQKNKANNDAFRLRVEIMRKSTIFAECLQAVDKARTVAAVDTSALFSTLAAKLTAAQAVVTSASSTAGGINVAPVAPKPQVSSRGSSSEGGNTSGQGQSNSPRTNTGNWVASSQETPSGGTVSTPGKPSGPNMSNALDVK